MQNDLTVYLEIMVPNVCCLPIDLRCIVNTYSLKILLSHMTFTGQGQYLYDVI